VEDNTTAEIESLIGNIRGLSNEIEKLLSQYNQLMDQYIKKNYSIDVVQTNTYWVLTIYRDSLLRIQLLIKQNFYFIETLGILAITRYIFELTIWIKLIQKNKTWANVYQYILIENQLKYYKNYRAHLKREIVFMQNLEIEEKSLTDIRLEEAKAIEDEELRNKTMVDVLNETANEIDNKAKRKFTIYGEAAKKNGYGFQAYLIETKALPEIASTISTLERHMRDFKKNMSSDLEETMPARWNWFAQAKSVDMQDEYDFIYSYTSRLLHATPGSITTNYRNLELTEIRMFLGYVHIRLADIIEILNQSRNDLTQDEFN